jgi:predicted outer membrane repeat protein
MPTQSQNISFAFLGSTHFSDNVAEASGALGGGLALFLPEDKPMNLGFPPGKYYGTCTPQDYAPDTNVKPFGFLCSTASPISKEKRTFEAKCSVSFVGTRFDRNQVGGRASSGGGLAVLRGGRVTLQDVVIDSNKADVSGGGIYMQGTGSLHAAATVAANNACLCINGGCFAEGVQIFASGLETIMFTDNSVIHLGNDNESAGILFENVGTIADLEDSSSSITLDCLPGKNARSLQHTDGIGLRCCCG